MATILTVIPYHFYPPTSGGALRCFYNLKEIARHHNVFVLTTQPKEDFLRAGEAEFPENVHIISVHDIPRYGNFFNRLLPDKIADFINYRFLNRSLKGITNALLLQSYPALISLLKRHKFDIVIYESLEAINLFRDIVHRRNKEVKHVYDAHNVDSELWLQQAIANKKARYNNYAKTALAIEKSLYKKADVFFCCSNEDKLILTDLNEDRIKGVVIPNGVDISLRPFDLNKEKYKVKKLLFCGSLDYEPNKEGILWFYKEVLPLIRKEIPELTLTVIGNVTKTDDYEQLINDASVHFIGKVECVVPYYKASSVAVVPLLSGSGTRLKILEAMSMGNPIVSTAIGAEGIDLLPGEHLLIASQAEEFADNIVYLLSHEEQFNLIRLRAYEFVAREYDWQKIGDDINKNVESIMNP